MPETLESSIDKAITEHSSVASQPENTEKKEVAETIDKKEDTVEKKEEPVKQEDTSKNKYGFNEIEIEQAQQLLKGLKDPESAPAIVDYIARGAGYTKIETKQEAKEAKESISDALKKKLGPEFDFLAERLLPALEEYVDEKLKTHTSDIRQSLANQHEERLQAEAATTISRIAKEVFQAESLPDNVITEMNKLMDRLPPSKDLSVNDYVENIYYAVAGRLNIKPIDKDQLDRRSRNRNDAPSRLASEGTKQPVAAASTTFKSLDEAIEAAIAEVSKEK